VDGSAPVDERRHSRSIITAVAVLIARSTDINDPRGNVHGGCELLPHDLERPRASRLGRTDPMCSRYAVTPGLCE